MQTGYYFPSPLSLGYCCQTSSIPQQVFWIKLCNASTPSCFHPSHRLIPRPSLQDLAPLLKWKFDEGATALSWTYSIGASVAILLPMTNFLQYATSRVGDRSLAGICALFNALFLTCIPWSTSVSVLYTLVGFKAISFTIFDPTKKSFLNSMCEKSTVGAFMGWQHSIRGITRFVGTFIGGALSEHSLSAPFHLSGLMWCIQAGILLFSFTPLVNPCKEKEQ